MATNAPRSRRTHIIRILGTNREGEILPNMWADVERIDWFNFMHTGDGDDSGQRVGTGKKLRWADDPTASDYNPDGLPSRQIDILKVCKPDEESLEDPNEWIPIPIIRFMNAVQSRENYMALGEKQRNSSDDGVVTGGGRKVQVRRIIHRDTNIDDEADAAFDADPSLKVYVVPGNRYEKKTGDEDKDDTQYVEHEIVNSYSTRGNVVRSGLAGYQGRLVKMLNQYQIDESEEAKLEETGPNGINPPYRLDPYQNIVNIKLGLNVLVVIMYRTGGVTVNPDVNQSAVKLVDTFSAKVQNEGLNVNYTCKTYKVSSSAAQFMSTSSSAGVLVAVFAISGKLEDAITQARDGAKLILPAAFFIGYEAGHSSSDIGYEIMPPGALWVVSLQEGTNSPWKITYEKHRNDNNDNPPNKMIQVYPTRGGYVGASDDGPGNNWSGYAIWGYRLDKKGTETKYGILPGYVMSENNQIIDPVWWTVISHGPSLSNTHGIQFQDPPPLISRDR